MPHPATEVGACTEKAMNDQQKRMGRMDHGKTVCGRIVMSRWDQPERSDNDADRQRFIDDVRRSGFVHSEQDRYEGDAMPDWVGQSHCEDLNCRCQEFLNRA